MLKKKRKSLKYRSRLSAAIHETAAGLHRIGLLDKATMREFDISCLTTVEPLSAKEIATIRRRAGVSQGVFAHYLQCEAEACQRVGAGRKTAERAIAQALVYREGQGARRDHIN
jgi:putative transcriptional regulator